jgi:hypothetical protein
MAKCTQCGKNAGLMLSLCSSCIDEDARKRRNVRNSSPAGGDAALPSALVSEDSSPVSGESVVQTKLKAPIRDLNGDYLVIPFIGKIKSGFFSSENAETVSRQLQSLINQYSQQGWELHDIAKVDIEVTPGCLASLFGAKTSYITFDQVVFRRARP